MSEPAPTLGLSLPPQLACGDDWGRGGAEKKWRRAGLRGHRTPRHSSSQTQTSTQNILYFMNLS